MVADTPANAAGIVKVAGRGVGSDRTAALNDAYRDAVERAVGMYVDAEQMVKNDELVNDKILTHSDAYIEKCDVVKETKDEGLVTVKVLAVVRRGKLTKRMTEVMPPNTVNLGRELKDLHAQMVTKEKCAVDGKALMENVLMGVNPLRQLYTVDIVSPKPHIVESKTPGKVWLNYLFRIQADRDKYLSEFLPPLQKVLGQISTAPARSVRLNRLTFNSVHDYDQGRERTAYLQGPGTVLFEESERHYGGMFGESVVLAGDLDVLGKVKCPAFFLRPGMCNPFPGTSEMMQLSFREPSGYRHDECLKQGVSIRVIDKLNESLTACKATDYVVDAESAKAIIAWQRNLGAFDQQAKFKFTVVFLSESKDEIGAFTRTVPCTSLVCQGFAECHAPRLPSYVSQYLWFVSPFVGGSASCFYVWKAFELPKDDLSKVSAMTIEIAE